MAIDKKLIHFKTKENFMSGNGVDEKIDSPNDGTYESDGTATYGQIKGTSIVFIKDTSEIWTHGNLYRSVKWSVLESNDITFTIYEMHKNTTYTCYAAKNMTWLEWVNSEYNTIGAYANGSYIGLSSQYIKLQSGEPVNSSSLISKNTSYTNYASCCFVAGTLITMSNDTLIPIENVKIGDYVKTMDLNTMSLCDVIVKNTIQVKHDHILIVDFENGSQLTMALYHPLYTTNGWHSYTNHNGYDLLKIGDSVLTENGSEIISNLTVISLEEPVITYNLDVKGDEINDNFFANGFVAHNASCPETGPDYDPT